MPQFHAKGETKSGTLFQLSAKVKGQRSAFSVIVTARQASVRGSLSLSAALMRVTLLLGGNSGLG